eukprot:TRINITY_DN5826_c0_g1_i1.p1 TRINITY_DN5826_c0_g1~~TRINITY_DN5826_c0_g1_i1.p1  ORF type:complete len:106 (+),score=4.73 TRINITY_DN5826_c0_g1_i1:195-512(+)
MLSCRPNLKNSRAPKTGSSHWVVMMQQGLQRFLMPAAIAQRPRRRSSCAIVAHVKCQVCCAAHARGAVTCGIGLHSWYIRRFHVRLSPRAFQKALSSDLSTIKAT